MIPIFDINKEKYPSQLNKVLDGQTLNESTLTSIAAINEIVRVDSEDPDFVRFINGNYTDVVLSFSLEGIIQNEPPAVALKIIELFHLDSYFDLENTITNLKAAS